MAWTVVTFDARVDAELDDLPADMRARYSRIANLIASVGLQNIHEPHVKHIEGVLWEMRMTGKDGISRALYVTEVGERVVVLRIFVKKTQKTPKHELDLAVKRKKQLE